MRRILIVSHRDIRHSAAGGANLYVHEIFKRLTRKYDISIISTSDGNLPSRERIDGIRIFRMPFRKTSRLAVPLGMMIGAIGRADLIIDNGDVGIPWLTPLYTRSRTIAVVYQVLQDLFRYELRKPLSDMAMRVEPWVYRVYRNDMIVTCSQSTKNELLRFRLPGKRINVIRPGIDDSFISFQPDGRKFENPTIICISRFRPYKGLGYAIKAMKHVLEKVPAARLIIAGNGDDTDLRKEISRTSYSSSIQVLNRIPHRWNEEKKTLLSRCHIALIPSIREGYGIVVIEANACGTPAIGWTVPGVQDSIIDGKTGLLVPFGDISALARAMVQCISGQPQKLTELSKGALDWARQHSWDVAARQFAEIIDSII